MSKRSNQQFNSELFNTRKWTQTQKRLTEEPRFYTNCAPGEEPILKTHVTLTPSTDEMWCLVAQVVRLCSQNNATLAYKPLPTLGCDSYSGSSIDIACNDNAEGSLLAANASCINDPNTRSSYFSYIAKSATDISTQLRKQNISNGYSSWLYGARLDDLGEKRFECKGGFYADFCNKSPKEDNQTAKIWLAVGIPVAVGVACCFALVLLTCLYKLCANTEQRFQSSDDERSSLRYSS